MPENQRDSFEDRLADALRDAGDGFAADRAALVSGGRARGERTRVRRRAGLAGGVAGVALVGVGSALLLPRGGTAEATGTASAASTGTRPAASPSPFTGKAMYSALEELLPDGRLSGSAQDDEPYLNVVYDDGDGAAALAFGLARTGSDAGQVTECPDKTFTPYDACSTSRLPDGSTLRLFQGYEYPDRREDTRLWSADLVTAEGQHVSLSEWNAPAEKGAEISREEPPLSPAELKEVVTADVWRGMIDSLPGETDKPSAPASPETTPSDAPGEGAGDTLTALLPKGLDVVDHGDDGSGEFAYVIVDDGRGQSLVQVNVEHGMNDPEITEQLWGDAETLPDGTLLSTQQGAGDDRVAGAVMWTVDTLRKGTDGFRVVISAFNNGAAHAEPERETPALTMDQLKEMALSEEWEKLR
ncbi:hypothetical protein [Streptomyces sp. CRN 30]|uniref:hypothetical protein n=1 Tax=Streptomyces sp. CRN 30 TaxID=3075613 RepID=UPI002A7FF615|nr:hypothetical protein [Streptomyces sp. CRN 30]